MDLRGLGKAGYGAGDAQDVCHEGAAAGACLGQNERLGRALVHPGLRQREAQHFAEHLRDFRGGGEVACRAEGIAGGVIAELGMQQTLGHVVCDGQRTLGRDALD